MSADAATGAYFFAQADGLVPVPEARSPWSETMLHGRLLAGLAARAVEADVANGYAVARLTVDMFRSPPMDAITVTTQVVRDGRRVRVLDVSMHAGGNEVARARAVVLLTASHPDVEVWRPTEWSVPPPEDVPPPPGMDASWGGWEIRPITPGGFWSTSQKQIWSRDTWQLVGGEPLSPLVRAALSADLPNPLANSGAKGLAFINGDLTMYLARYPASEWIGLEVSGHVGANGIAVGSCTLYDQWGAIGSSTVSAVANPQALTGQ